MDEADGGAPNLSRPEQQIAFFAIRWLRRFLGYEDRGLLAVRVWLSQPRPKGLTATQSERFEQHKKSKPDPNTWTSEDLIRILDGTP